MKKLLISISFAMTILFSIAAANAAAEMSYSDGVVTISGMDGNGMLISASYDSSGVLETVHTQNVQNGTNPVSAKAGDVLYLWKSIKNTEPVCEKLVVDEAAEGNNVLIVYFSRAGENWQVGTVDKGNTAVIEEYIENKISADVFEIKAAEPYPVSYDETLTRVNRERDNNERPAFLGEIDDFDKYDTVFLGYPIWYGGLPMIMYTFLEEYDMGDKTVIPFSTHGGSGWGSTKNELKKLCPDATFLDGYSIAGTEARKESTKNAVEKWLEGLDI